jgi:hypothetical protein
MKKCICLVLVFITYGISLAEMRLWEDKKGNVLEGEYKCTVSGKVVLTDTKGKDHALSISSLSQKDQKYLQTKIPPKIDIEFKKFQDHKSTGYSMSMVGMYGEVTLKKTSRMPYEGILKATLFIIGEDAADGEYILMDKSQFNFDFKTEKEKVLTGEKFKMRQYSGYSEFGTEYKGYLVVVYDPDGAVLVVKSNGKKFEEKLKYLSALKQGARFPDDMRGKSTSGSSSRTYY